MCPPSHPLCPPFYSNQLGEGVTPHTHPTSVATPISCFRLWSFFAMSQDTFWKPAILKQVQSWKCKVMNMPPCPRNLTNGERKLMDSFSLSFWRTTLRCAFHPSQSAPWRMEPQLPMVLLSLVTYFPSMTLSSLPIQFLRMELPKVKFLDTHPCVQLSFLENPVLVKSTFQDAKLPLFPLFPVTPQTPSQPSCFTDTVIVSSSLPINNGRS